MPADLDTRREVESAELGQALREKNYESIVKSGSADAPGTRAMREELDRRQAEIKVARSKLPRDGGGGPSAGSRDREHHASPSRRSSRSRRRTSNRAGPPDDGDPDPEPPPLGGSR